MEQRFGSRIDEDPLMSWIPRHAANCVSRYRIMDDGRTPDQRRCGETWKRPVVEFGESVHFRPVGENNALRGGYQILLRGVYVGHHERSGAAIFLTPDGVKRGTRIARMMDKMKGEECRSRLVCREIKKARDRDEQLGPEYVFSPMPPSEGLNMLVSTMMTGHDDENHVDGPFEMIST